MNQVSCRPRQRIPCSLLPKHYLTSASVCLVRHTQFCRQDPPEQGRVRLPPACLAASAQQAVPLLSHHLEIVLHLVSPCGRSCSGLHKHPWQSAPDLVVAQGWQEQPMQGPPTPHAVPPCLLAGRAMLYGPMHWPEGKLARCAWKMRVTVIESASICRHTPDV